MKKAVGIFKGVMTLFLISGLIGPFALAATAPDLGIASSYAIFGKSGVTNDSVVGTTHIWGNVGADTLTNVTGLNDATQVDGTIIAPAAGIQTAASAAYDALDAQPVTASLDLAGTHTITPGVYTVGASILNGQLTLDGPGVYIFRSSSSITTTSAGTMNLINGATPCNVFWQIPDSMTIGTGSHIEGTIIAQTSLISLATGATLKGRAFSLVANVALDSNQITEPTCIYNPVIYSSTPRQGTINVVKTVINDNGGTKKVSDFPLFVNGTSVISGVTNTFRAPAGLYTVTETSDSRYTRTFSGDCDTSGNINLIPGDNKFCIVTNNDMGAPVVAAPVPPLIDVVKVPSPLSLPNGPGAVTYTYTLRNIGTVPVTDVTMVGDTCSPITLISGDVNNDKKLDVTETWVHTCTTNLTESHTNTVVATGWANGLSATDIASAHVVVGLPIVPPLIHVTKVPSPFTLTSGGGWVTYTEKITNPGTVALSNVKISDDKCSNVIYAAGDTNNDAKLDPSETWTYTCKSNLTKTTTNTVSVTGDANGLTARDFALATVVVASAVPTLPSTGFSGIANTPWTMIALSGVLLLMVISTGLYLKKRA